MSILDTLTENEFQNLPLVVRGESKEVRYLGDGKVVIKFLPTIYSFTSNRAGIVEGSDTLRLQATRILVDVLRENGMNHAYNEVTDKWVLADLLLQRQTEKCLESFRPSDLTDDEILQLDYAPPIEVVVKRMHSGTSKHRYFGMSGSRVRDSHPLFANAKIWDEDAYPVPIVRFDWRNPLKDDKGKNLADEILPEPVANWFIDVQAATRTALSAYEAINDFLGDNDIVCYDLCLFISEDGKTIFGEISQDCGRYRHFDLGSLDKDVWRTGGSSEMVLEKWGLLLTMISSKGGVS
ncbi:MAG TPA: hypothetical protein PKA63_05255 [Oligoflexia bacterium]|nr:hypothetical protein [Oligoflexia bacterium]HMP48055.1 hypothetical protein [Oligoflexia bacterium]